MNAFRSDDSYSWADNRPFPEPLNWCPNSTKNKTCTVFICSYGHHFNKHNCCLTDRECTTPFASICVTNAT